MTQQKAFTQKIIYLVIIGVLLGPLYFMGSPGGALTYLRDQAGLAESSFGEIDPAGSTVKLATFGLRGVAIALLWHRCQEFEKKKDWNNVIATAYQLTTLEPRFTTIWEFQGWKLAYNASAEFDDYRERYRWVIRGIDYLIRGVEYNLRAPKLCKATGWTISQKVGIADENLQYRRLLREDEDFAERHATPEWNCNNPEDRDNWRLGRRWYAMGEKLVIDGESIGKESEFLFFSHARLNLFNYATWIRKDGCGRDGSGADPIFGDRATRAWNEADREWREFGQTTYSTAIPEDGSMNMAPGIKAHETTLQTAEIIRKRQEELFDKLKSIDPKLYEQLHIDRWNKLADMPGAQCLLLERLQNADRDREEELKVVRAWLDENEPDWQERLKADFDAYCPEEVIELKKIPALLLEETQRDIVNKWEGGAAQIRIRAMDALKVNHRVLLGAIREADIPEEKLQQALSIVQEIEKDATAVQLRMSNLYRDILNYEYRLREVEVERTAEADRARELRHMGRVAYHKKDFDGAVDHWIEAMVAWDELFEQPDFEDISTNAQFIREHIDIVERFPILLDERRGRRDGPIFPKKFLERMPMEKMIRAKVNQENSPEMAFDALEYARKEYERGEFEDAEKHLAIVIARLHGINRSIEFMERAPLPDVRDKMIEAFALYVECLQRRDPPIAVPSGTPLKTFVELMLEYDPLLDQVADARKKGNDLLEKDKVSEAQAALEEAMEILRPLLQKYPIIWQSRHLTAYEDIESLAADYAEVLRLQEKTIPNDFLLRPFLLRLQEKPPMPNDFPLRPLQSSGG